MSSWVEGLQKVFGMAERIDGIAHRVAAIEQRIEHGFDRINGLEVRIARLEEMRETFRETVRADITQAVAELKVQYVQAEAHRQLRARDQTELDSP